MVIILITIALILFILEILTMSTYFIWLALGVLIAGLSAIFIDNVYVLLLIGGISVFITIGLFRNKYILKYTEKNNQDFAYDYLISKQALVTKTVQDNRFDFGEVKINGQLWSAITNKHDEKYQVGETVKILKIDGALLIVEKKGV